MLVTAPPPGRRNKPRNDILQIVPQELAEQLTLYESQAYCKITPRECASWIKSSNNDNVHTQNLHSFIAIHDKIATWVKSTILNKEGLGKRADTVDHWIKVAEVSTLSISLDACF